MPTADGRWLDEVPDEATVLFPAHGVPLAVRAEAGARGLRVRDATCPLAAAAHADVRRFAERGDVVVLIGRHDHAATWAFTGQAAGDVVLVETAADVETLDLDPDPDRVCYQVQVGTPVEDAAVVIASLRVRYPRLRGLHPDGWCYAADDRALTTLVVAASCDVPLVGGSADSADARDLADQIPAGRVGVHILSAPASIRPEWLTRAATVGVVATLSTAPDLTRRVIDALSGWDRCR